MSTRMNGDTEEMSNDSIPLNPESGEVVRKDKKTMSPQYTEWLEQFEKETSVENKIRLAIDFMRAALSQGETPRFKDFWECRRQCLLLFKETIAAKSRATLWGEYIELSNEARRLKQLLDEQAAFAIEQIELAIQSIEANLEHFPVLLENAADIAFPKESVSLKDKQGIYTSTQKELDYLNTLAMQINAMRKEIIKTEMRIRIKNKLLERLSACGDRVFPRRKELIKNISKEFLDDVEQFAQTYFKSDEIKELPLHILREEIKHLQSFAKILTLNTHSFSATRHILSECWDKVKAQEKDRKKEILQKKQSHRENFDLVMQQIAAFAEQCQGEMTLQVCNEKAQKISDYMRTVELGRDEVKALRDELAKAKKNVIDRHDAKEHERLAKEREVEEGRKQQLHLLKEALTALIHSCDGQEIGLINEKREQMLKEYEQMRVNKVEKQTVDRLFKQLKDAIAEKREKALLSLSEDDLKSLEQLKFLLKERMERRSEIKTQLEQYRKALGGSGFDFEKAMHYRELIESEKSSLEKIEAAIEELECKIEDIEG